MIDGWWPLDHSRWDLVGASSLSSTPCTRLVGYIKWLFGYRNVPCTSAWSTTPGQCLQSSTPSKRDRYKYKTTILEPCPQKLQLPWTHLSSIYTHPCDMFDCKRRWCQIKPDQFPARFCLGLRRLPEESEHVLPWTQAWVMYFALQIWPKKH